MQQDSSPLPSSDGPFTLLRPLLPVVYREDVLEKLNAPGPDRYAATFLGSATSSNRLRHSARLLHDAGITRDEQVTEYMQSLHYHKFDMFWSHRLTEKFTRAEAPLAHQSATLLDDVESIVWTDLWFTALLNERLDRYPGKEYVESMKAGRDERRWLWCRLLALPRTSEQTIVRHSRVMMLCLENDKWGENNVGWLRAAAAHYRRALDDALQEEDEDEFFTALEEARELFLELPFDECALDSAEQHLWTELPFAELSATQIRIRYHT